MSARVWAARGAVLVGVVLSVATTIDTPIVWEEARLDGSVLVPAAATTTVHLGLLVRCEEPVDPDNAQIELIGDVHAVGEGDTGAVPELVAAFVVDGERFDGDAFADEGELFVDVRTPTLGCVGEPCELDVALVLEASADLDVEWHVSATASWRVEEADCAITLAG